MERFAIKIDKKLKANLYKICRLCGIDNPEMVPILPADGAETKDAETLDVDAEPEMSQKIQMLIGLMVTKDDKMPQTMCSLCVDKINDFYEFREMCYATNTQTRKLLGLKNPKKPPPSVDIKPKVEIKEEEASEILPTPTEAEQDVKPTPPKGLKLRGPKSAIAAAAAKALKLETTKGIKAVIPPPLAKVVKAEKSSVTPIPSKIPKSEKKEIAPLPAKVPKVEKSGTTAPPSKGLKAAIAPPPAKVPKSEKKEITTLPVKVPKSEKSGVAAPPTNTKLLGRDSRKRKLEDASPPPAAKKETAPPAVSNKKLRLAAATLKEAASKKAKQKFKDDPKEASKEVKDEIKEEPNEEKPPTTPLPPTVPEPAASSAQPVNNKLKQVCTICSERFATKAKLEAHTRTLHIPRIERFVCTACNEVITKSFDIKNHQLWHKLSKTPYICGLCGEHIVSTYAYARHVREHCFETPTAFMVLDRECPQCHTSYATNFLYNTHPCAVKAKRCAGCNRLQRSDAEFIKHSALCAKVYLNYSKHIMPAVEAQEDEVRIKNENDVEAAAEEMARLTGVSLDMSPVVQLTRLSSPLLMAANQCVSIPGIEDSPTTTSKKSSKKGVSKKELKRVDELLKSTLDALVSIKHEPEVHVDTEPPLAEGERSDNDGHSDDDNPNMDVGFQEDDYEDSDHERESAKSATNAKSVAEKPDDVSIKLEIEENHDAVKAEECENATKSSGGGLKLKIRKEHGQLNSSIIEQQKSVEKRAEKRKKKKKHKDKVKDKQKSQKEQHEEQNSLDSFNTQQNEDNVSSAESPSAIRIKTEPVDAMDTDASTATATQGRRQPEATIMTSIPMMQFQIACISEGVEFNGGASTTAEDQIKPAQINQLPTTTVATMPTTPVANVQEDVKPNRAELDRMLKISQVSSSAIDMEAQEAETANQMDHDGNSDDEIPEHNGEEDEHRREGEESENAAPREEKPLAILHSRLAEEQKTSEIVLKPTKLKIINQKSISKPNLAKSRNKACKSTAKPSLSVAEPVFQISSVQCGVTLPQPTGSAEFTPIFIKPEPQNRGYSDEPPPPTPSPSPSPAASSHPPSSPCPSSSPISPSPSPSHSPAPSQNESEETASVQQQQFNDEEQAYISSIDFNNITIKQEKDLDINDVQVSAKKLRYRNYTINGVRKRKLTRTQVKIKPIEDDKQEEVGQNMTDVHADPEEDNEANEDEEAVEEEVSEEEDEELEEEQEDEEEPEEGEEEEDEEEEEEEEREYRELEYPPELKSQGGEEDEMAEDDEEEANQSLSNTDNEETQNNTEQDDDIPENNSLDTKEYEFGSENESNMENKGTRNQKPTFVISSVCSHASDSAESSISAASNLDTVSEIPVQPFSDIKNPDYSATILNKLQQDEHAVGIENPIVDQNKAVMDNDENIGLPQALKAHHQPSLGSDKQDYNQSQEHQMSLEIQQHTVVPELPVLKIAAVTSVSDLQRSSEEILIKTEDQNEDVDRYGTDICQQNELKISMIASHHGVAEQFSVIPMLADSRCTSEIRIADVVSHGAEQHNISEINTLGNEPLHGVLQIANVASHAQIEPFTETTLGTTTESNAVQSVATGYCNTVQPAESFTKGLHFQHQVDVTAPSTMLNEAAGGITIADFISQGQTTTLTETKCIEQVMSAIASEINADVSQIPIETYTASSEVEDTTNMNQIKETTADAFVQPSCQGVEPLTERRSDFALSESVVDVNSHHVRVEPEGFGDQYQTESTPSRGDVVGLSGQKEQNLSSQENQDPNATLTENVPTQNTLENETGAVAHVSYDTHKVNTSEGIECEMIDGIVKQTHDLQLQAMPFIVDDAKETPSEQMECNTIEGVVDQSHDLELQAKPHADTQGGIELPSSTQEENEIDDDDEEEYDEENYEDEDEEMETEGDSNVNLEEQQNLQNLQQQESSLELPRPTALALHPYLEDISSSSNSFLSNTLSQTPPPTQSTSARNAQPPHQPPQLNEETENVLNESSDMLSRPPPFNFDNINEIAENNNNANLEREQLQDDHHQQPQDDVT